MEEAPTAAASEEQAATGRLASAFPFAFAFAFDSASGNLSAFDASSAAPTQVWHLLVPGLNFRPPMGQCSVPERNCPQ